MGVGSIVQPLLPLLPLVLYMPKRRMRRKKADATCYHILNDCFLNDCSYGNMCIPSLIHIHNVHILYCHLVSLLKKGLVNKFFSFL